MKRICAVTGSRADYGPMRPLLKALRDAPDFALDLLVIEPHFTQGTTDEILADGFNVYAPLVHDADALLVLGDRSEILTVVAGAYNADPTAPIIHLYGGERTDGSRDDARRHAITKLSDLHFVAAEPYRGRVIQLGEDPARIFTVGALAVDAVMGVAQRKADWREPRRHILATFHPCDGDVAEMLTALDALKMPVVITAPNSDPGRENVHATIELWMTQTACRANYHWSVGQDAYLDLMRHAAVVVGNSSSALIEAPALGVPSVNIGTRQAGRLKADSVIDCECDRHEIARAIQVAISPGFRASVVGQHLPYGGGGVAQKIIDVLRATDFATLGTKRFRDLPC